MGEQTWTQPATQSQDSKPPSPSRPMKSEPNLDSNSQSPLEPTPSTDPAATSTGEFLQNSKNYSNPSKIPIRPRKIRKLSGTSIDSTPAADKESPPPQISVDDSSSKSSISTVIVEPPATTITTKNRRRNASQISRPLPQIIKPLSANGEIELAIRHLRSADPLLVSLIDTHAPPQFEFHHPPFLALTKSILYQQLAYKAGAAIYTRFISLCGGEDFVRPDTVLALSAQQLKQIGISGRKASYLYDLANKYNSGILSDESVVKMDDRSLFTMLSMVKGIGSWSVHMFMIFSLHRPDVLPVSDLGVRKGVQLLYSLEELPRPSQMEQLCEKWKPYRSVGAWYMWRFVEGKGTPAAGATMALEGNIMQPLQQIEPQQDERQHHQLQFLESVNGIGNLGECIWGQ
ncbi:probable DNA-3-methyladenine glycosylase 2 isoform X1 [Olea europaea subsp. europaea]|uniref:Probable DNA-3-methyladenine glycosylase 2 isoform X1 n=1 Tax=Olea europaea subsp. europaea TaxID=158383 RepID=A0A8S0UYX2_OLEEU|nr:probable DNA-3-methyladenine glycosylase 2 isoform X1 [Olea europaea subsp. europaea]